jgi:hypothetical protein
MFSTELVEYGGKRLAYDASGSMGKVSSTLGMAIMNLEYGFIA